MGPKEKGCTNHTSNNHIQLQASKRENRNENRNTTQTEKTLLYTQRTLKCTKMPPDRLVEADILGSLKEQISL